MTPIENAINAFSKAWPVSELGKDGIAKVNPEVLGNSTPANYKFRYIDISSVENGHIDWSLVETTTFSKAPSRARRVIRPRDTLISTVRPIRKSHAFAEWDESDGYICSTGFAVVRSDGSLNSHFFKHLPFSEQIIRQLVAWQCGTNYPAVNERDIRKLNIPLPPPAEQEAIASILGAADKIIEQTREAVKRAGDLRKALMQASFHFELCSEPLTDTDFGRIPRTWEWIKGKKAFVILSGGTNESSIRFPNNRIESDAWFMKVDDFNNPINRRSIVWTKVGFQTAANPIIKLLPKGTLIIAKRGAAILKNRVRISAVPLVLDPNLMGIQMCDDLLPEFFAYQLECRNLSRFMEDSGIPQLNNKDLYPRYFLRAPEDEQRKIINVIKAADAHEDALWNQLDAYETLKRALMYDLLTGKVRVNHAIDQILSLEAS
jgi:type I restriction enzyme S subunit